MGMTEVLEYLQSDATSVYIRFPIPFYDICSGEKAN